MVGLEKTSEKRRKPETEGMSEKINQGTRPKNRVCVCVLRHFLKQKRASKLPDPVRPSCAPRWDGEKKTGPCGWDSVCARVCEWLMNGWYVQSAGLYRDCLRLPRGVGTKKGLQAAAGLSLSVSLREDEKDEKRTTTSDGGAGVVVDMVRIKG